MLTKLSVYCDRVIEAGWLAAIIVAPLFFNVYSSRVFEPDKLTLVRSIASVMAVAWIIKVIDGVYRPVEAEKGNDRETVELEATVEEAGDEAREPEPALALFWKRVTSVPLVLPTLILVVVYILSTVTSIVSTVSLWGSYQRLQGTYTTFSYIVIFFMILQGMRSREQLDRLVTVAILVSLPVSLYGLIQHAKLDPLPWGGDVTSRVASNMGNPIFVAAYLIMTVPLTIGRLIEAAASITEGESIAKKAIFIIIYLLLLVAQIAVWVQFGFKAGLWSGLALVVILPFFSLLIRKPTAHFALLGCYSFILSAQLTCIVFSRSRGPWLGLLGSVYIFVLIALTSLRRAAKDQSPFGLRDVLNAVLFVLPEILLLLIGVIAISVSPADRLKSVILGLLLAQFLLIGLYIVLYAGLIVLNRGTRWLWLSWLGLALTGILVLVGLNLPQTPLAPLRTMPFLGDLGRVFNTVTGTTGRVRLLIWEGALNLIAPHPPIQYPGGQPDKFNFLRPLIGYGPEAMYVAYNRFYPPDLAHNEARNASPDRSHNETLDALVTTGLIGFVAYMFLFGSIFYYGLKRLRLIVTARQRNVYIALWVGGALIGSLASWWLDGTWRFIGVGMPTGSVLGLALYVGAYGVIFYDSRLDRERTGYSILFMTVLAALVGHFIEIHFGIAIAATRTYFWTYVALLVIIGHYLGQESALSAAQVSTRREDGRAADRRRRKRRKKRDEAQEALNSSRGSNPARPTLFRLKSEGGTVSLIVSSFIVGLILVTMRFDYITSQFSVTDGEYSIFWLFAVTWLLAGVIIVTEWSTHLPADQSEADWVMALVTYPLISLGCFALFSIAHSNQLHINFTVTDLNHALRAASKVAGILVIYYIVLFLLILIMGGALMRQVKLPALSWRYGNWWLYPILVVGVAWIIITVNLKTIMADIYYKQASPYEESGQWDGSIEMYRQALNLASYEDFYLLFLGRACLEKAQRMEDKEGDITFNPTLGTLLRPTQQEREWLPQTGRQMWLTLSQIALSRARELNPLNTDHSANLGRLFRTRGGLTIDPEQRGRYLSQAVEYYRQATSLSPQNAQLFNEWGSAFYLLGRFDEALDKYQRSVSLDPIFFDTYVYLGDVYQALNQPDKALEAHLKAVDLNPGSIADQRLFSIPVAGFLESRLTFYVNSGQIGHLIAALESKEYKNPSIYQTLGSIYLKQERYDEATAHFQTAVELKTDDLSSRIALGYIYAQQGQLEEAAQEFQRCVEIAPDDLVSHRNLGGVYLQMGRLEEARAEFERAAEIAPDDLITHQNLTEIYRQLGLNEEAIREYQRLIELAPNDFNAYRSLAVFYYQLGRIEEAKAELDKVAGMAGDDLAIHQNLAAAYQQVGLNQEALREYQKCVALAPDDLASRLNLALFYHQMGNAEEARAEIERAAAIAPDDLDSHRRLADVYRQMGMSDQALAEYQKCVELAPDDFNTHKDLALIYQQLGYLDEALAEAQLARDLAPEDQKPVLDAFIEQLQQGK